MPPGEISPNIMWIIGPAPPSGVNESCMQFTEPFDVPVVAPAHKPHAAVPRRTSLPSMFPPDCATESDWSAPRLVSVGLPLARRRSRSR